MAQVTVNVTVNGQPAQAQVRFINELSVNFIVETNELGEASITLDAGVYRVIAGDGCCYDSLPATVNIKDDQEIAINIPATTWKSTNANLRFYMTKIESNVMIPQPNIDVIRYTDNTYITPLETQTSNNAGNADFTISLSASPQTCYFVVQTNPSTSYQVNLIYDQVLTINHVIV
ncbi:MAG TPA: hypothetical protein PLI74_08285 [Candidatus Kapabacteria bacterium]|nr:hypothetical protein [Ignavibacteria bacterium]HRK59626.1 hypothetical protein [Candidatus Kapabacteria bacterium]